MMTTELQQVISMASSYNLIPIVRRVMADTETPIRLFKHFAKKEHAFLLESVEGGAKWARYSFIGTDPFMMLYGKNGEMVLEQQGSKQVLYDKPLELLKAKLRAFRTPVIQDFPPFTGGAIGFFGYDLLQYYEKLPAHRIDDMGMNDIQFMFCDQIIVFDHLKQQLLLVSNIHIADGANDREIEEAYNATLNKIDALTDEIRSVNIVTDIPNGNLDMDPELGEVESNLTKEQFIANVNQAKDYIRAGDIFQVVLSQRFNIETTVDPLHVYRVLRVMNPSPYMYYLKMGEQVIVGTSPEALVKVSNGKVETRPIAGTRPRGATVEEDKRLEQELLADEKERAEHLMLVDLGRNDIGKVSKFGSVRCDSFMEIERYSHVMHIVSNVSGELREDKDFFDAFISCLPAGTVSGAPKLRAMEIIAELENEARGAYAGAIGYLGFGGSMDACITIRTIIFKDNRAYVQSGAGIVWDSNPESEYLETVNKAKASLKAIRVAEQMFSPNRQVNQTAVNSDYEIVK
ncbi:MULTISPECIES: anthranilate synthase component I [Paenibacillus]|uniref:anthranilate synthase component I n=1 Tax=Paenibacillus TaxID=44249 RepID=UPI00203CF38E|nr:anthranilate synthase component I [Paenibacillus camelliae]MCM3633063.1 anthranilate synthase component I [Paenibacillus camelliae]